MSKAIKSIKLLHPEIMNVEAAVKRIQSLLQEIEKFKDEKAELCMKEQYYEDQIKANMKELKSYEGLYEIEYEEPEQKQQVASNPRECPMVVESNGTVHI